MTEQEQQRTGIYQCPKCGAPFYQAPTTYGCPNACGKVYTGQMPKSVRVLHAAIDVGVPTATENRDHSSFSVPGYGGRFVKGRKLTRILSAPFTQPHENKIAIFDGDVFHFEVYDDGK